MRSPRALRPAWWRRTPSRWRRIFLTELDMLKGWHDVYVRFGSNTLKTFGAPSDPGVILGENDLFFIDIGPVWKDWEGDGGDTFVVGANADMARCAADARKLFHIVRKKWIETGLSGKGLYDFATAEAAGDGLGAEP